MRLGSGLLVTHILSKQNKGKKKTQKDSIYSQESYVYGFSHVDRMGTL